MLKSVSIVFLILPIVYGGENEVWFRIRAHHKAKQKSRCQSVKGRRSLHVSKCANLCVAEYCDETSRDVGL